MGGEEAATLPYTEMGAGVGSNTLTRLGLGRDSKDRMNWDPPIPRTFTNSTAASDRSSYQFMEFTPESYQNTLTDNYENAPLLSESPESDSQLQGAMAAVSLDDHSYQAVESGTLPANNSEELSGPSSPLTHTYFEGNIGDLAGSSGEREHHYQGVYHEGPAGADSLARSVSVDNLRSPTITDFYFDRSPTLGSLDLAFSFSPANMPDWMNSRQLPSLPRDEVPPTEENPYIMSPKQSRYAYEEVNNVFPPTPAQKVQQTQYHSVINATPPQISTQGHIVRRGSQFSEGYVDSKQAVSYEDVDDDFRATTARIVQQDSVHQAHAGVVEPGVTYTQIAGTTTTGATGETATAGATGEAATAEPEGKPVKRKSFTARTLERVKMKKSKSLVDLSSAGKSPEKKSLALEDAPQARKNSTEAFRRGMKKSQSNPDLLSGQSTPEATPHFLSPKRNLEKQSQSPVSGVRRKFGLGLKIMRNKSRSNEHEGEVGDASKVDKSKSSPKVAKRIADVKGVATTEKTISFTRKSQGQLQDLPLNSSGSNRQLGLEDTRRQRTVSSGSSVSFHAVLNEQRSSTGMISNPLACDRRTSSASSGGPLPDGPELDEEGYLSPTDIGSPIKGLSDPLEADMSGRPLPERPLPSPPAHSNVPPIHSQSAPLMGAGRTTVSSEVYHV